jgi:hypothetical protein
MSRTMDQRTEADAICKEILRGSGLVEEAYEC